MESKFRGLPYRPWKISCITKSCVTKSRRHNQIIVRNCTVVMVAVVRQVYLKIFRFQGGRILIASYYHVTTFYKSSHVVCRYGITTFKISYPSVFKELLGRNKLCDSLTFIDVNFFCPLVRMRRCIRTLGLFLLFPIDIDIAIAIGEGREGKVF